MKLKVRLGVLGVGNMGGAIIDGLLAKKMLTAKQILVFDKLTDKARAFSRQRKVTCSKSVDEIVAGSDVLLLAFKPQDLQESAAIIQKSISSKKIIISILAGTPIQKLKKYLGSKVDIVRAMPNLGAKVGASVTALSGGTKQSLQIAEQIFSACGEAVRLEEKHFDLVTAISGSGPAYFFYLMELLVSKAQEHGIPEAQAKKLAVQTALGAAKLAAQSQDAPAQLREQVTSKGGTTAAALQVLWNNQFGKVFHQALEAARQRGQELSQS